MGYHPRVSYHGRGAFESMGARLAMSHGEVTVKEIGPRRCPPRLTEEMMEGIY